jgi:hypothetical protein
MCLVVWGIAQDVVGKPNVVNIDTCDRCASWITVYYARTLQSLLLVWDVETNGIA